MSKKYEMESTLAALARGFSNPELYEDLYQEGALAWLESEAKGEDRAATEAWEAMNDFLSKSSLDVTVPMHEGTRTALKKIRAGETWDGTDKLSEKAFYSLYWALKDLSQVSDEMPHAQVSDPEFELFFKEAAKLVLKKMGVEYHTLFYYQYGPLGYSLQDISAELDVSPSKAKKMNQTLSAFLRSLV